MAVGQQSPVTPIRRSMVGARRVMIAISLVLRVLCGLVLIVASIGKLQHPYQFLIAVYNYHIIGPPLGRYFAMILPYVELVAGIALVGGVFIWGALTLLVCLTLVFLYAICAVLIRHMTVNCDCFGFGNDQITGITLVRSLAFVGIACLTYVLHLRTRLHPS
jgi:putative oxidoreductase